MTKPTILVVGKINFAQAEYAALSDVGTVVDKSPTSQEEFLQALELPNLAAIYMTGAGLKQCGGMTDAVWAKLPKTLKVVACFGAGYDWMDVSKLGEHGVQASHTPDPVVEATADTAIYLMLGALRNFNRLAVEARRGNWCNTTPEAHDPEGKVLGILGLGGIGKKIRDRAAGFEFSEILYHNRSRVPENEEGIAKYVSFDELLAKSDVLSLSLPLNKNTHHLLDAETIAKCKDGVVIVNTARGAIIDENALVEALKSGKVSTAGLDVYEEEPKIHPGLLANENLLLLPHVGTHTVESRKRMEMCSINNIRAALEKGKVINLVPELKAKF